MRLVRYTLLAAMLATVSTCGGRTPRQPAIAQRASQPVARPMIERAIDVFDELADVMDRDDAQGLAAIADPNGGIRIWQRPGATLNIMGRMTAGEGAPSVQIAHSDLNAYYKEGYRRELAEGILSALAIVDVDPSDPAAPAYRVDCTGDMAPPQRASLATHPALDPHEAPYYLEEGAPLDRDLHDVAYVLSWHSQIAVWLVNRGGKLFVSDVFVDSPCDA